MRHVNVSPRSEYRADQHLRAEESPTLAKEFASLSALKVRFSYQNPDGTTRNHDIKFTVNIDRVSSVFRIDCMNSSCVGGDFDLTNVLREAIADRSESANGEMRCEGWLDRLTIDRTHCHQRMTYDISLEYHE